MKRRRNGGDGTEELAMEHTEVINVRLNEAEDGVVILDQTRLPRYVEYRTVSRLDEMAEAIVSLRVRGAPAIGIFAGYCLYVLARTIRTGDPEKFQRFLSDYGAKLNATRPTAVNLSWAVARMERAAGEESGRGVPAMVARLRDESLAIRREDEHMCTAIAAFGLTLLHDGEGVLTHCNAGPLATSRYGTALGPLLLGRERGMQFHVFADETRPLLQGARLTAWELQRAGVDVTIICDSMASIVMKNGWVSACLVGCDRVARNGDTANKIGTSGVAILARHYHIPFYVLGPTSTIDLACAGGGDIRIEQRDPEEIRSLYYTQPMAPEGVPCYNPAFDVTDHSLITAIITERGVCRPPYDKSLPALFAVGA